jgi:hypothetical protein
MARGRFLSKSLSTSQKFGGLVTRAPHLFEFLQALYPLLVMHADDYGRLQGDVYTVKQVCYPCSPRSLEEFAAALQILDAVQLIVWYAAGGKRYVQIVDFDAHQVGLHKRTAPRIPAPNGLAPDAACCQILPGHSGKYPDIPGNSGLREEKRREEKIREDEERAPPARASESHVVRTQKAPRRPPSGPGKARPAPDVARRRSKFSDEQAALLKEHGFFPMDRK